MCYGTILSKKVGSEVRQALPPLSPSWYIDKMNHAFLKLRCIVCLLHFFIAFPLIGLQLELDSLLTHFPDEVRSILESAGRAFRYDVTKSGIMIAPNHAALEVIKRTGSSLNPDVMVEGLYLVPYASDTSGIDLHLYNITRRVSEIKQVRYSSSRKKAVVPLFRDVYHTDEIRSRKRLPDPVVNSIPMFDSILLFMKETVLGGGYYNAQYVHDGESLSFTVKNVSVLRSLIKIVDKENFVIHIILFPTEKGYLVYGYCGVVLANRDFIFRIMDPYSAFYKRLYAMVLWVENSLHNTDKQPIIGQELGF